MKKNTYIPSPLDTGGVELQPELLQLVEMMSENVHEVWAETRMGQGWTYGAERDDSKKEHPCLVPYSDLPEEEKEYDRRTCVETLKTILSLGYRITPAP